MVTFIIGLSGVLIGAGLTALIKTWGDVIVARSAASIIRMEIQDNIQRAALAIGRNRTDIKLREDSWTAHRVQLVPLLPNGALHHMSVNYGACWIADDWISRLSENPQEAKQQIEEWISNSTLDAALLMQICRRSRLAQLVDLLKARPTFPKPPKGELPVGEQLAEMKRKLLEAAARD